MVRPFEVMPASAASAADLPATDVTITLVDYDFQISQPLTPGKQTILVENGGPQAHEVALLKLAPGKTVADFAAWDAGGMKGPPPAEPVGGVVALDKGARATFTADLSPGEYGLICFVPDTKDGRPHLAHGMIKTIKVG
jgi:plastocyanin